MRKNGEKTSRLSEDMYHHCFREAGGTEVEIMDGSSVSGTCDPTIIPHIDIGTSSGIQRTDFRDMKTVLL